MENVGKRINKYISDAGVCSRREADRLIESGHVEIQRKTRKEEGPAAPFRAHPGDRVFHGDTVYVNGQELPKKEPAHVYYIYNKPAGVICTTDREVPENIIDAAGIPQHVTYAGRLDKDTGGLIVLTNDGSLIDRMMRASSYHEKEYIVTVDKPVSELFLDQIREGVKIHIDDEETLRRHPEGLFVTTRPCRAKQIGERKFEIVLTQGFNRQIRRMCSALGYGVSSIERIRVMNLKLGDLKTGEKKKLTAAEVEELMRLSEKRTVLRKSADELKYAKKQARVSEKPQKEHKNAYSEERKQGKNGIGGRHGRSGTVTKKNGISGSRGRSGMNPKKSGPRGKR